MTAKKQDVEPAEFVMTQKDDVPDNLLPSDNLSPELLAEGHLLPAETTDAPNPQALALRVQGGEFGATRHWQIRKLKKSGYDVKAVMAEVDALSNQ